MISNFEKLNVFIEASAIAEPKISGIGHNIVSTINSLCEIDEFSSKYKLVLLTPFNLRKKFEKFKFPQNIVEIKSIAISKHFLDVLFKYDFTPPLDLFFGPGTYIFPNYRNCSLLFSKSITYIYDVAFSIFPETVRPDNLQYLKFNLPKWIKRSDLVVTISENSRHEIVNSFNMPKQKIGVVPCGVNHLMFYRRAKNEVNKVKSKYKIKGKYLLTVGNIEPRKNISRLLDAYISLPAKYIKEYSLVLIGGGGWLNEDVFEKISSLQNKGFKIIYPKTYIPDQDLPALYSGARLLIHPALHEGFGLPPLEALACQTPIAVSNIGALKEIFGGSAFYFNPVDIDDMNRTILSALNNKVAIFEQKADKIVQQFNWNSSAKTLLDCIKQLNAKI